MPAADAFGSKRGFTVPVGTWLDAEGRRLGPLVANTPGVQEIADPAKVERLFQSKGKHERFAAWTLLFYALWHRAHVLGRPPCGDVFETLANV